jgi:hypothetical protein
VVLQVISLSQALHHNDIHTLSHMINCVLAAVGVCHH